MSEGSVAAKKQKLNDGSAVVTQVIDLETNVDGSIAQAETSKRKNNLQYSHNNYNITNMLQINRPCRLKYRTNFCNYFKQFF